MSIYNQWVGWVETDSAENSVATATRAAESGKNHIIYAFSASYSGVATGLLQLKDDTTVIYEGYVVNGSAPANFPKGIEITSGNAVSATLAAGGLSITGKVNIHGVTR